MIKPCCLTFGPIVDDFHRRAKRPFVAALRRTKTVSVHESPKDSDEPPHHSPVFPDRLVSRGNRLLHRVGSQCRGAFR